MEPGFTHPSSLFDNEDIKCRHTSQAVDGRGPGKIADIESAVPLFIVTFGCRKVISPSFVNAFLIYSAVALRALFITISCSSLPTHQTTCTGGHFQFVMLVIASLTRTFQFARWLWITTWKFVYDYFMVRKVRPLKYSVRLPV